MSGRDIRIWLRVTGFWFLALTFLSGCAVWRPLPFKKPPPLPALPEIYQLYYDYPAGPFTPEVIKEERHKSYILKRVEIPLYLPPELVPKDPDELRKQAAKIAETDKKKAEDMKLLYLTRIDYYIPAKLKAGEKRPAILISSILGGTMVVDHFARYYAGRGYLAALVHRKRLYWDEDRDIRQVEDYLRTSVIRLRQAMDWLLSQPEVDPNRIGTFSISYGAILHSMLAAVDPRPKYHILSEPAGELGDLIMECPDKAITKLVKKVHEQYGWPHQEIRIKLRRNIVTDPLYLAPYVPKHKVEVYAALFDRVVGARRSFRLWKALKKPRLRILPFGHYGGILILPYLQTQSYRSFKKHL
jgi:hypothetical protein